MTLFRLILLCALLASLPSVVAAQGDVPDDLASVEIRPGWRTGEGRHYAALVLRLAPGWKTYWRAPGSLGIPPHLDWGRSRNLAAGAVAWPRPTVIRQPGGRALGYGGAVVLPLVLRAVDGDAPIRLRGRLSIGVCAEICVPVDLPVRAELAPGGADDPVIRRALADRPAPMAALPRCRVAPVGGGVAVTFDMAVPPLGGSEAVAVEVADPSLWVTDAETRRDGDRLRARVEILSRGAVAFDRSAVRVTAVGRDRAYEAAGCRAG